MKFKIGDWVRVISDDVNDGKMIDKIGIIKIIDNNKWYRILFKNYDDRLMFGEELIYIEFINLWNDDELEKLTEDQALAYLI